MENTIEKLSLIESEDIESRIYFLKRRAAEADFLREERDMLISRLKLYNPDYIWPDAGINKYLNKPLDQELEDIQKKNEQLILENGEMLLENEALRSANDNLKMDVEMLEQELYDLKRHVAGVESVKEENLNLKEGLQNMEDLKKENELLLSEKKTLEEDFRQIAWDPKDSDKLLLRRVHTRAGSLSQQVTDLQKALYAKDIQIDVLNGKISQLNAKLNEPIIAAKIKLSMGKELSTEEAYVWTVHSLEVTNNKVNCQLQMVSEQLDLLTEKYMNLQEELKTNQKVESNELLVTLTRLTHKMKSQFASEDELNRAMEMTHYEPSEKGSTEPGSRRSKSEESVIYPIDGQATANKLAILASEAQMMSKIHERVLNLRDIVRELDTSAGRSTKFQSLFIPPTIMGGSGLITPTYSEF